jgi:indole-3-glycerol phosphate synthase
VKRRSPSKGAINPQLNAQAQAAAYVSGGAAAISVLTEPVHFGGSAMDLELVRRTVQVPVLKKDFHVDPVQLAEARALGASAALLIARALDPGDLDRMARAAREFGLETVIEVRDEGELRRAVAAGATAIGINNRDLETLEIDRETSLRLLPIVPPEIAAIAESGVRSAEDVRAMARAGADAVLVGSTISAAQDPAAAVRALVGVARVARGR